ncbi:MAG: BtrH N-terminal domain-containing protein [Promethearchaeota archaeon]
MRMSNKYIITDFDFFGGLHCATSAVRKVLQYNDLPISEEMLFGLGGGIGFIYWYVKQMPAPMVGGRGGGRHFIEDATRRAGVTLEVQRTTSSKKGHAWLLEKLAQQELAVIYADMAYLPYMGVGEDAHFGQHVFVVYGLDEQENVVYISDRAQKGVTVTVNELKKARASKFPPWPPQHTIFDFQLPKDLTITKDRVIEAMQQTVDGMVNPLIRNLGLKGIEKWSKLIVKWPDLFPGEKLIQALYQGFIYIETGGTGGSAFRPIYARYLQEVSERFSMQGLDPVIAKYEEAARIWSEIATHLLPDEYPMLKRARELILEQNRISEEQPAGAIKTLHAINQEFKSHIDAILAEVAEAPKFLRIVREWILQLYQVEKEAIELLHNASN